MRTRSASWKYRWYCWTRARVRLRLSSVVSERGDQFREREVGDVRIVVLEALFAVGVAARPEDVDERSAGVPRRVDQPAETPPVVVLDEDAVGGGEPGLQVRVTPPGVGGGHGQPGFVEPPGKGPVLDQEFDVEAGSQHLMERANQELVLADRKTLHRGRVSSRRRPSSYLQPHNYTTAGCRRSRCILPGRATGFCHGR